MGIIRKIRRSLEREGVSRTVALCFRNLLPQPKRDHRPSQFDIEFGISTEGRVELGDLDIDRPSNIFGVCYSPTPPRIFDKILSLLPSPERYSFIDLGSGKGRVVLMAARKPFKSVIGVEFSHELCSVAEANLAKFKPHVVAGEVRIVCEDAALFQFPDGPIIVYCYFAFEKEILAQVLKALSRRTEETIFAYYNSHYPEMFVDFESLYAEGVISIWRRPRPLSSPA